jgi:glucose/arabinose dehydrogenase
LPFCPPAFIPKDRIPKRTAARVAGRAGLRVSLAAHSTGSLSARTSAVVFAFGASLRVHFTSGGRTVFNLFSCWQQIGLRSGAGMGRRQFCRPTFRPRLEALESRCVPSTLTVNRADDDVTEKHTLRWAVANAVSGDEIQITAALKDTPIVLTHGELLLSQNVTIEGVGNVAETVSGGGTSRVFEIAAGASVTIEHVTITGGDGLANPSDAGNFAGGGGGILVDAKGTLTISGCTLSGNSASRNGGAIFNQGALTIENCTIDGNSVRPAQMNSIIFSNFGPGQSFQPGGYSVSGAGMTVLPPNGFGAAVALSFTPTSNFHFSSVELPLVWFSGTDSFIVYLMSDAGGSPGTILETFPITGLPSNNTPAVTMFVSTNHTPLEAGTTYWIAAAPVANDTAGFWLMNPTGASGYSRTANDSKTWLPQVGASPAMEVDGTPMTFGGGISNSGTLTVSGSVLSGNSVTGNGGAVFNDTGSVALSDCTLSGNSAGGEGGAIENASRPGALFVSSFNPNVPTGQTPISQILRYDSNTGAPVGNGVFVPENSAGLFGPQGLAFSPNGNLFVASDGSDQILEFDGTTGAPVGSGVFVPAGSAGLFAPTGLTFGPNGNLFVSSTNKILEFDGSSGAPVGTGIFVSQNSAGLSNASGLVFGPNGNLFVSDSGSSQVLEYDGTTGAPVGTGVFVPNNSAGLSIPLGLTFGPNGNLFVSSEGTLQVLEYNGTTGAPVGSGVFVSHNSAGLRNPYGLTFGPNGNLFVADSAAPAGGLPGYQVLEYDGTTGAPVGSGVLVSQGSAGLTQPTFLVFSQGSTGTVSIEDCTLTGNTANVGGGISNDGTLTVSDSTLTGNFSSADGGGIFNLGTLTISDSTLSGNSAAGNGGGICNTGGGTAALGQCVVANNSASGDGGGIFNSGEAGAVTVGDSMFIGNTPDNIFGLFTDLGGNTFS